MKNIKVKQEKHIATTLKNNCLTTQSGSYLHDLVELCEKIEDNRLFEIVPIRLVAYLEDSLRVNYEFILNQPDYFEKFIQQNKGIIKFDNTMQLLNNRIPLSVQIAYSFKCNNIDNVIENIHSLIGVDLRELGSKRMSSTWNDIQNSINKMFEIRHRLCHESGIGVYISKDLAREWIRNVGCLLSLINEAIVENVYEEYCIFKKGNETNNEIERALDDAIKKAQCCFKKTEQEIAHVLALVQSGIHFPGTKPNLNYLVKWKEYRDIRIESENFFPDGTKQNKLYALRKKTQYNKAIIEEIKIQHRDFINYSVSDTPDLSAIFER